MASLYRRVTRALKDAGWSFHRQAKGDHEIWRNGTGPGTWAVSVPANLRKLPTAESILKQAGLTKDAIHRSRRDQASENNQS